MENNEKSIRSQLIDYFANKTPLDIKIELFNERYKQAIIEVEKMQDEKLQLLCFFSLLDSLAQENEDYPTGSGGDCFAKFVLEFGGKWDFLKETDPVTLYYRFEERLKESNILDNLVECNRYSVQAIQQQGILDRIRDVLASEKVKNLDKYMKQHQYVYLLYKLRSKITHEYRNPGDIIVPHQDEEFRLPHYALCTYKLITDNGSSSKDVLELVVPASFIKDLLLECIEKYTAFCRENNRTPFLNNKYDRKFRLAWYDE